MKRYFAALIGIIALLSPFVASAGGYYDMQNNYGYQHHYMMMYQPNYYNYGNYQYQYQPYQNYQSQYYCSDSYGNYMPCSNFTYYQTQPYQYTYTYPSYTYNYPMTNYYAMPSYNYSLGYGNSGIYNYY